MQRIRTVKPELFRHEELFEAEQKYDLPLRLAFIGLFSCCDREGRFRWKPKQLKIDIFPYDEGLDMARVLDALVTHGFIVKYACDNELYGCIPSWHKHQHINHREAVSLLPEFKADNAVSVLIENDASSTREPPVDHATEANPCMPMGKGKGKELEKEREMEGKWKGNTRGALATMREPHDHNVLVTRGSHDDEALMIFAHWKKVMGSPHAVLDSKRRESITRALAMGYSIEQLCHAIDGCSHTPHNMGKNEQGQRYDGLHIIFRDADQIDRFMRNFSQPPKPITSGENRAQLNVKNLQNWLDKKANQADELENKTMEESYEGQ